MILFDTPSQQRFHPLIKQRFNNEKNTDIYIFIFDLLFETGGLDELYINEIITNCNSNEKLFYLVGNKCDNYNIKCEKCNDILLYHREKAKMLIDKGIINKYFEVSGKTGEGLYELFNILKLDSIALVYLKQLMI